MNADKAACFRIRVDRRLASQVLAFLLIPVYTRALDPGDYGRLELLNRTSEILGIIVLAGLRMALIRFVQDPLPAVRAAVERIEELGYTAVWYPETPVTREAVLEAALLLEWTQSLAVCSGIAGIWNRDAAAALNAARGLNDAFGGRFVLGLGVSHREPVTGRGHDYGRPLATMRAYLVNSTSVAQSRWSALHSSWSRLISRR